eukprot:scaffold2953_cov65-Phaeocystis_antarctica.AAC.1
MWSEAAQSEKLTLLVADNNAGYFGVHHQLGKPNPYQARVMRGGKNVHLGTFLTAEEAALCVARSPEGQAAAARAAAPPPAPPLTSEEAQQQAQAEGLTLRVAKSKTGYFGVHLNPGKTKPYQARVKRGGKDVYLGCFATAEEAALCVARSPEGRVAAAERAAAAPLTSEEARQQAQAEGLKLRVADNTTGYHGVYLKPGLPKPFAVQVRRGSKLVNLGTFATAEEAALCVARSLEGQAAAQRAAAAPPPTPALTSEEARQQAQAEGLTLRVAENTAGYFGVRLNQTSKSKPFAVQVSRGGKQVHLGSFATAEEAALCVARSLEGQAAAALSEDEGQGKAPAMPAGAVLKEEGAVPPMPLGAFVKDEEMAPPMPPGACFKDEEVAPPMPPDTAAKREHEVVVKEEERSDDRPKRRRSK